MAERIASNGLPRPDRLLGPLFSSVGRDRPDVRDVRNGVVPCYLFLVPRFASR